MSKESKTRPHDMSFILELWKFLKHLKKIWFAPIIIIMVILGGPYG